MITLKYKVLFMDKINPFFIPAKAAVEKPLYNQTQGVGRHPHF